MVVLIPLKNIDVRSIIGAVVVLLIIGSIIFGVFYFFAIKPAAEGLESSKLSALFRINDLSSIGTSQAVSSASTYSARIQAATSTAEIESVLAEVNTSIQLEQRREELLDRAVTVTSGTYYSASSTGDATQKEALSTLLANLQAEINAKTTLSELLEYETSGTIYNRATTTWRNLLEDLISGIQNESLVMTRGSPPTWSFKSKSDALAYVAESSWQVLCELDFEGTSYVEVPISDTANRSPTIRAGCLVNIYLYDTETGTMRMIVENATVSRVLYSIEDLATVAWSLSSENAAYSYSTNVWEALKAAAAGSETAALEMWEDYGSNLMNSALEANVLDFTVNAIYVVKVPTLAGESIVQYEFYESATKDIVLAVDELEASRLLAAYELERSKLSALSRISELSSIGTSQAVSSASTYSDNILAATSTTEIRSIMAEVDKTIQKEQKRKELLDLAVTVTSGTYYSADGTGDTKQAEALSTLLADLQTEINDKTTLSALQNYETSGTIYNQATTIWQNFLNGLISSIGSEPLAMKRGIPTIWYLKSETDALAYVAGSTWQVLRELDFEEPSYVEVPVSDTVDKTPTIRAGSHVNVYYYDTETENLRLIVENATVSEVLYSSDDIAAIAWTLSYDGTAYSYSTNIWQAMMAAAAGSENAALVTWENYGTNLMDNALSANVLDFTVNAIYVVKVPTLAGESIVQYEFYETATKDVTLTLQTT